MSHRSPLAPPHEKGFMQLTNLGSDDIMSGDNDIPLTTVRSNSSEMGVRRGEVSSDTVFSKQKTFRNAEKSSSFFHRSSPPAGMRKVKRSSTRVGTDGEEERITAMGKLYHRVVRFSPVMRYLVYILPIGALLAIPIVIGATVAKGAAIGGVRLVWFFTWIECVWLSLWVAKFVAQTIPWLFMFLCGVVSSGTRKYALVIKNLEIPISFILWAVASFVTFQVLTSLPDNPDSSLAWIGIMKNILAPILIATGIYLAEKLVIQLISISYHQRSFATRIKDSKRQVLLLGHLYEASRALFPMYCHEFAEEDYIINDSIEALIASGKYARKVSGSTTPMKFIGGIGRFGDKVTSVFGNIASEIAGKQVFNPTSSHSVVVEALEKKRSSEALAKRLWMSFVVEGSESLSADDIREVLGPSRREEADEAFKSIDSDSNGDISLDEMIMKVVDIGRERKYIANSMKDIGQAISVLDSVLVTIAFIISIFIFVSFLNANFVTTLATAGTTLLSLSFVFAVTTQEFLGSCIFLFVKHPYDVGDRVDIEKSHLIVEQISLLYTVFKQIESMRTVQVPNIVLSNYWIENVTRSRAMKEQLELFISFDTSLEDIETLRKEMEAFVRHPENTRDFQPDIVLECTGVGNMDKLQLKVEIRHKSNWSNETVRAARRSKFMCALVLAIRKVPLYAPGGGGLPLGDPGNPAYSVAISDELAVAARDKRAQDKEAKRLIPTKSSIISPSDDVGKSSGFEKSPLGSLSEDRAAHSLNARSPTDDDGRDDGRDDFDRSDEGQVLSDKLEQRRSHEIEDLRQGLLRRESTRGRRRRGLTIPPPQRTAGGPAFNLTLSSPMAPILDEEANLGVDTGAGGMPSVRHPGQSSTAAYSTFPASGRANTAGLQQLRTAPGAIQSSRDRRMDT